MYVCILSVQNTDYLATYVLVIDIKFKTTYRVCLVAMYLFHDLAITSRPSCVIPNSEITLPPCLSVCRCKSIKFECGIFTPRFIKNPFACSVIIRDGRHNSVFPDYS